MACGSVEAPVTGGYPSRNELDLSAGETLMMLVVFDKNALHRQILNFFQLKMPPHFIRH